MDWQYNTLSSSSLISLICFFLSFFLFLSLSLSFSLSLYSSVFFTLLLFSLCPADCSLCSCCSLLSLILSFSSFFSLLGERERERERECVCVCVCNWVCLSVHLLFCFVFCQSSSHLKELQFVNSCVPSTPQLLPVPWKVSLRRFQVAVPLPSHSALLM